MEELTKKPLAWLLCGAILLVLSQARFGVGVLAWLAPVPWLHYLRRTPGVRARLGLLLTGTVAWSLAFLKIVTDPLPPALALGFGLPLGVLLTLPYLVWDRLRPRIGEPAACVAFAAALVVAEWCGHGLLPFGTWGAFANTQLDQLALLQVASLTGLHGVAFLMALCAAVLERALAGERSTLRTSAFATAALVLSAFVFGQSRLASASGHRTATRRVAAVGTDSRVGTSQRLPGPARLQEVERGLTARTEVAAAGGASLVVWNEAATMVRPADEPAFVERLQNLAARLRVELVAAYVVPVTEAPLRYENKYVFLRSDGSVDHTYLKHEPVPGEPAVRGQGPMRRVGEAGDGAVSGAICYDYDFPYLGRAHARVGADIVALPSSDWRGIDPIHTQMAALRAIEGGHAIVRSTRFGLSAVFDAYGRARAWSSHFDDERRVLIADVPRAGVDTLYGRLGEWFPATCALLLCGALMLAWRRRRSDGPRVLRSPHAGNRPVGGLEGRAGGV